MCSQMNEKLKIQLEKQQRLEKALRENLRKRKIQQRERKAKESQHSEQEQSEEKRKTY